MGQEIDMGRALMQVLDEAELEYVAEAIDVAISRYEIEREAAQRSIRINQNTEEVLTDSIDILTKTKEKILASLKTPV